jgi:hypothetical protein
MSYDVATWFGTFQSNDQGSLVSCIETTVLSGKLCILRSKSVLFSVGLYMAALPTGSYIQDNFGSVVIGAAHLVAQIQLAEGILKRRFRQH